MITQGSCGKEQLPPKLLFPEKCQIHGLYEIVTQTCCAECGRRDIFTVASSSHVDWDHTVRKVGRNIIDYLEANTHGGSCVGPEELSLVCFLIILSKKY